VEAVQVSEQLVEGLGHGFAPPHARSRRGRITFSLSSSLAEASPSDPLTPESKVEGFAVEKAVFARRIHAADGVELCPVDNVLAIRPLAVLCGRAGVDHRERGQPRTGQMVGRVPMSVEPQADTAARSDGHEVSDIAETVVPAL